MEGGIGSGGGGLGVLCVEVRLGEKVAWTWWCGFMFLLDGDGIDAVRYDEVSTRADVVRLIGSV